MGRSAYVRLGFSVVFGFDSQVFFTTIGMFAGASRSVRKKTTCNDVSHRFNVVPMRGNERQKRRQ